MTERPRVENAPGITWRRKGDGWEAIWRARADLIEKGFRPKNQPLWSGIEPSSTEKAVSDPPVELGTNTRPPATAGVPYTRPFTDPVQRTAPVLAESASSRPQ